MILQAWILALRELADPRFRRVMWLGLALALALLFAMYALLLMVVDLFTQNPISLPLVGELRGLGALLSPASLLFMLMLSVFLMAPVASAFTGLFLDDVADQVERRHHPHLPPPRRTGPLESLIDSARYFGLLVALNLLGLVFFAFSGGIGMVAFWAINAALLAREYMTMIANRRLPPEWVARLRQEWRLRLWLAGMVMAVPLSIPGLNLVMPVLGAAAFTHLFHAIVAREAATGERP